VVRVANPLDKVFGVAVTVAPVEDGFDFVFIVVVHGYGRRRGRSRGDTIGDGGRGGVGSEEADMEDRVNVQRGGQVKFVGDRGDFGENGVRADESGLKFP
jgi:hypothetical protein